MLTYEITYRLAGPEIFHDEVSGRNFAECAHKFASKMQPGYVVLAMRFIKATKI
jgi:hypothetical protein